MVSHNILYKLCICWLLLSNQSFYRQIAGCWMGVGDEGRTMMKGGHGPTK